MIQKQVHVVGCCRHAAPHGGGVEAHGSGGGLVMVMVLDRRSLLRLQLDVLRLQRCVRLAEHIVLLLGLAEQDLQILDALVFPLPVCSLGSTILCPPALIHQQVACQSSMEKNVILFIIVSYRKHRRGRVLIAVLSFPLGRRLCACWVGGVSFDDVARVIGVVLKIGICSVIRVIVLPLVR